MFSQDRDAEDRREARIASFQAYLERADAELRAAREGNLPIRMGDRRPGETDGDWDLRAARVQLARDGDGHALLKVARALISLSRHEEAEQALRAGLEIDPSHPDIYEQLVHLMLFHGRIDEAIETADAWVAARPDIASAWSMAAKLQIHFRGSVDEAMRYIRRGFRHVPKAFQLFHAYALVCERLGRSMDAKRAIAKACRVKRITEDPDLEGDYARIMAAGKGHTPSPTEPDAPEPVPPPEEEEEPLPNNILPLRPRRSSS